MTLTFALRGDVFVVFEECVNDSSLIWVQWIGCLTPASSLHTVSKSFAITVRAFFLFSR